MNRKLVVLVCAAAAVSLAGCGTTGKSADSSAKEAAIVTETEGTFEELVAEDSELMLLIAEAAENASMGVEISGDDIRFIYTIDSVDGENAEEMINGLFETDAIQETFEGLREDIATSSGCDVNIIVDYVNSNGDILYEGTF